MTTEGEPVTWETFIADRVCTQCSQVPNGSVAGQQLQLLAQTTALLQPVPDCPQDTPY